MAFPAIEETSSAVLKVALVETVAKDRTLGKINDKKLISRSKRKVNLTLSYLIIETKSEFTREEITSDNISSIIKRKISVLNSISNNELIVTKDTIKKLNAVSENLPIVLEIDECRWKTKRGEVITFMLQGDKYGDIISELFDYTHIDTEDWEDDRMNALVLDRELIGIFYAHLGFTDVVYHPRNRTFKTVIFRLKGTKVWFTDGLKIHTYKEKEKAKDEISFLIAGHRHPSLFKIEELEEADPSASPDNIAAYFIPGLTNIKNYKDLPKRHYFTGKCLLSKKSYDKLVKVEKKKVSEPSDAEKKTNNDIQKTVLTTSTQATSKSLHQLAESVTSTYTSIKTKIQNSNSLDNAGANEHQCTLSDFEYDITSSDEVLPVKCFLTNGNFMYVNKAVLDENTQVGVVLIKKNEKDRELPTVAVNQLSTSTIPLHSSGRFVKEKGFIPDVDSITLNMLLASSSDGNEASLANCARIIVNILYDNNYAGDFITDLLTFISERIMSPTMQQYLAGKVAEAVSGRFDMRDDVLFMDEERLEAKKAGGRSYEWYRPITLPLFMFTNAMKHQPNIVETIKSVSIIIDGLLTNFLDTVVSSGGWAVSGIRHFLNKYVADSFLDKLIDITPMVGRHLLAIYFINEASNNMGVCTVSTRLFSKNWFDERTDFFIEPGLSFSKHVLSHIPSILFNSDGKNLSDVLLGVLQDISDRKGEGNIEAKKCAKNALFSIQIPGDFYKTCGNVTITIRDPSGESKRRNPKHNTTKNIDSSWQYAVPRALTIQFDNDDGFKTLLDNKDLESTLTTISYSSCNKKKACVPQSSSMPTVGNTFINSHDKLEHIVVSLPGFSANDIMTTVGTKTSTFQIREGETELVFWDPLLSISSLRDAAKNKLIKDPTDTMLKKTFNILNDGKIVINANGISSPGFVWLWKRFDRTLEECEGETTTIAAEQEDDPQKKQMLKFFVTKFGAANTLHKRQNEFNRLDSDQQSIQKNVSLEPAERASVADTKAFLQHDLPSVLTLLITRIMVVVSKDELPYIKKISGNVAKIMQHSLQIALDPARNLQDVMNRVILDSNSNGMFKDSSGLFRPMTEFDFEESSIDDKKSGELDQLSSLLNKLNNRSGGASSSSSNLTNLLQNNKNNERKIKIKRLQEQKSRMFPRSILSDMPNPVHGKDFTSGQILYVPFNPRDILTDIQWVDVMSVVEYSTRDQANALSSLNAEQCAIEKELRTLITNINKGNNDTCTLEQKLNQLNEYSKTVAANTGFVSGYYKTVTIDRYNIMALCRSILDVKFLIRIPNVWIRNDWKGVVETAVNLAFIALKENISKGIMVASRVSLFQEAAESIASAESMLQSAV